MSKLLVVTFEDEKKAYEGSKALADLHRDGSVSVYSAAVVSRDSDGKVSVKDDLPEGPAGTALGMMYGALVGVLGGPQGVVLGAAAGAAAGSVGDLMNLGVGADFLDDVGTGDQHDVKFFSAGNWYKKDDIPGMPPLGGEPDGK